MSSPIIKRLRPYRQKLPNNLESWRLIEHWQENYKAVWEELGPLFERHGIRLWNVGFGYQFTDETYPQRDNFQFLTPNKIKNFSLARWKSFNASNGLSHAARIISSRRDVVLRVVTAGGQGKNHLRIMRRLSAPPDSLLSNNHILPVLYEVQFGDIVILAFPKVMCDLSEAVAPHPKNSIEDVLYMVLQAFEGAAYLHRNLIGHQDLFLNNILVEWFPQSLNERTTVNRPRVYNIDFETAVDFTQDTFSSERLCSGFPISLQEYARPVAPELRVAGQAYCPFRLDMWQLGTELNDDYQTGVSEIDELWRKLIAHAPADRMTADEAVSFLDEYLRRTPPSELHRRASVPEWYTSF